MSTSVNPFRSIQQKLPLSILLLLVAVVGLLTALAYNGVKTQRLEIAGVRLRQVASELADLTEQGVDARLAYATRVAADRRIVAAASGDTADRLVVETLFDSLAATTRNVTSFRLASSIHGGWFGDSAIVVNPEIDTSLQNTESYVGPIRVKADSIFSEAVAPVLDEDSNVVGQLVVSRRAVSAEQVRRLITELIGGDASLLLGNTTEDLWTDLVDVVAAPSVDVLADTLARRYIRGEAGERYGAATRVPNAPWIVLVEYPLSTVLAPAHRFLVQVAITSLVLIAIGGLGASLLSSRLTTPLRELTARAESMAAGDYGVRLQLDRSDEIGQLAEAFNVMAEKVEAAHVRLEDEVAERTQELHATLDALRSTQGELVRSEKLAILGQLSSGLGHELRNPLGVMSNAVYYLQAVSNGTDEKVTQYLQIIQEQIGLSESIISALLDYAKTKRPETRPVQLRGVVEEQLRRLGSDDGVTVDVQVDDDIVIEADPVQLGQVLFNLLTNGKQALENGHGKLSIKAREDTPETVVIEISDTGRGIPAADVKKIFEPLYTTKARGIGLGLAVTNSFVASHGGTIEVVSREGIGSTFTIHWPASVAAGVC